MKVFIPCEDDFLDQLCPDDRLVPWQTCWTDYLKQRQAPNVLPKPQGVGRFGARQVPTRHPGKTVVNHSPPRNDRLNGIPENAPTRHPGIASSNIRDPLP